MSSADIYLDYQATTPLAPEALAAMMPWLRDGFANPHSPHKAGRAAHAAVEVARERILSALHNLSRATAFVSEAEGSSDAGTGAGGVSTALDTNGMKEIPKGQLIFTSGATEAANMALQGALALAPAGRRKIVTIATEHACVRDTALWLGAHGHQCVMLPVHADGLVDLQAAAAEIDGETALVAAMLVNNEIGVIQPIEALSALARGQGALLFCDAVQGFGRVPLPVDACDMIALSAHKIHGPKGVGALWLRDGVAIGPIIHGGAQEGGLRSGTLSPALCAGFGAAAELADARAAPDAAHVSALAARLCERLSGWTVNGSTDQRYAGNLNLRLPGLDAARLISELRSVAFSAGSACASGSGRPSHVLSALGLTDAEARASIRLGFGRYTTMDEIDRAAALIAEAAARQDALAA
ncbi:cysteine desulfurase family protein [Sphingobium boeckii]|uniref:Cysteine desulfurase n=1 Tax=Sphingobium boeckii TaxID=1082345 RepID=A0A7W9EGW6_9SPHN|nr:cysteine desulfurase family protein [Sphingobium boeckii]MBB5687141.1 cysteine desulfurase [Sphingobium boeckii]